MTVKITWLGHASFMITGSKNIYIDPWKLKQEEPADIILITHTHFDHFSPKDIQKIQKEGTQIIGPIESLHSLEGKVVQILPGKKLKIGDIVIETHPSYNLDKNFSPKVQKWLSYMINIDGIRIFHTGDSDVLDEFKKLKTDVLLVPVSGHYVMNEEEAAELTNSIKPSVAIPMHWGDIIGGLENAKKFQSLVKGNVKILKPMEVFEISPKTLSS